MRHLLVTNDFPPKVGGIQSYLWELWRRLPPDDVVVLTSPYAGSQRWDAAQAFRVERTKEPVLLPSPVMTRRVRKLAAEVDARAVIIDPALPLGLIGPHLGLPYGLVLHGAEVGVPARLPATRTLLSKALSGASLLITGGEYSEREAQRSIGPDKKAAFSVRVPPGVDLERFHPLGFIERASTRARLGLPGNVPLVLSVSRLVPRKGMDTLIKASALVAAKHPDLAVVIAGVGRDQARLQRLIRKYDAPVKLIGRVADADLPGLYAVADVFVMCCRSRWRGLEQEGFGIVFLEAAASGVACVAGSSGGAAEAVVDGVTGLVVEEPEQPERLAEAMTALIDDPVRAARQGDAARRRAEAEFGYDLLADRLTKAIDTLGDVG